MLGASQEVHVELVSALLEGGADATAAINNDSHLAALKTASQFDSAGIGAMLLDASDHPNILSFCGEMGVTEVFVDRTAAQPFGTTRGFGALWNFRM